MRHILSLHKESNDNNIFSAEYSHIIRVIAGNRAYYNKASKEEQWFQKHTTTHQAKKNTNDNNNNIRRLCLLQ